MIIEKQIQNELKSRMDDRQIMSPLRGFPSKFNELSIIITSLRDFQIVQTFISGVLAEIKSKLPCLLQYKGVTQL